MLSISLGYDVGYLTGPVAGGREGYYTGAVVDCREPAGLWYSAGAETLSLAGEVDADLMEALYSRLLDPRDPATHARATWGEATPLAKPHRAYRSAEEIYADKLHAEPDTGPECREQLRAEAERSARQAVAFLDATFSAPKSVTVLGVAFERAANDARAADDHEMAAVYTTYHKAVEDAVLAGGRASIDYLQDVAGYSRVGHHGGKAGRWIDAHQFVVAQFLQHDSRDRDPQLHVHQAILNRVLCADGTWRSLDSRAIHDFRGAAAAVGERVMEAHLARALRVRFATRPDGRAREVVGVTQAVMDAFSSRRHAITAKTAELVMAYQERFGREPSALMRTRLALRATLATRAAKSHHGETTAQRLDRWDAEVRTELAGGLAEVVQTVLSHHHESPVEPAQWSAQDVITRGLDAVRETRQSWSRSDLLRQISDALPGHLDLAPERVRDLLEGLTDSALQLAVPLQEPEPTEDLPDRHRLDNGESAFTRPGSARFATADQIAAERTLRAGAVHRGAVAFTTEQAAAAIARFAESGCELGADQAAALRGVMTSGARVEILSAPAGTGKSFVVGAIAGTWRDARRHAYGLAASEVATQVLAEEGLAARNIDRWLATQQRLDSALPGGTDPGDDEAWRLRPGDLVVVDEAGMADTAALLEIHRRCDAAGAKLLLTGDPRQLAAVGPRGTLADLGEHGIRYELAEVRRFRNQWEAAASLRLREGDVDVLGEYAKHGRIIDGGTAEQAEAAVVRAWLADTFAGRDTLVLVPTNEAAARMSAAIRAELVALGRVTETGLPLARQSTVAGIGDLVQARRNGWELIGHEGNTAAPINRRCYRVQDTHEDGSLVVVQVLGRAGGGEQLGHTLTLPARYVAQHVTLGYASTVHAAQGRTVDTAHTVIGKGTDPAAAYVGLTRGRDRNTAYCVTLAVPDDSPPGEAAVVEERTGRAVLADIIGRDEHADADQDVSTLALAERAAEDARSIAHLDKLADAVREVTAGRVGVILDHLAATDVLAAEHRVALAADDDFGSLHRLLRTAELAGHDPAVLLRQALAGRPLDGARSPSRVLYDRLERRLRDQLTPQVTSYADLIPTDVPTDDRAWLQRLAASADDRRRELGTRTAQDPPQWALEALGPVPADVVGREEWEHRAGWAAAWREWAGHTDAADPLGPTPAGGLAEKYAAWRAAQAALHLSDPTTAEQDMTEGRLRNRVRAMERETEWAPRWVADELNATHQAATQARTNAQLAAARADATEDAAERARLRAEADTTARTAAELDERIAALEAADTARAEWFVHTLPTRDAAARAKAELGARDIALDDPGDLVTAEEWLAAHQAEQHATDVHQEIRDEAELHDPARDADQAAVDAAAADGHVLETAVPDLREISTRDRTEDADPAQRYRVPTAEESAAAITRAQQALAEITARREAEAARLAEEEARRAQLAYWAEQDHAAEQATQAERDEEELASQP